MFRRLLLLTVFPAAFLAVDAYVWWVADPVAFQRFGSVGVLVAALMFGLDRAQRMRFPQRPDGNIALLQTELWLIALSTLQWGYGDLFHCWSHGNGWQMC